ncbi:MAG: hypothetical protein K0R24_1336 [Gammaproteobacteria bacterium]|nr:hypothetical protein [Gammaproteobacteria bacterium]
MKEKKLLTNKQGEVRELTAKDIRAMRSASEILPKKLLAVLPKPKRKRGGQSPYLANLVRKFYKNVLTYKCMLRYFYKIFARQKIPITQRYSPDLLSQIYADTMLLLLSLFSVLGLERFLEDI